jgi:hypothetical protein
MAASDKIHGTTNMLQDSSTPRTANAQAIKQVKSASKAYEALADAYTQLGNLPKLKAQIKAGTDTWAEVSFETSKMEDRR